MAFSIQDGIPSVLTKGDAASFTVSDSEHPATSWTSILYLKNPAGTVVSSVGSASGASHLFALSNTVTGSLTIGRNLASVAFSDGTHRQTSDWQIVQVSPDPASTEPTSAAAAILAAIDAALLSLSSSTTSSVSVDGVSYTRSSMQELQQRRAYWGAVVINERRIADAARGIPPPRDIAQFRNP